MTEIKEKFPAMESQISYSARIFGAILIWFIIVVLAGLSIFTFYELFRHDLIDNLMKDTSTLLLLFLLAIVCGLSSFVIAIHFIRNRKRNKYSVLVNDQGAFIFSQDGKISEEFLYSDLCAAKENYKSDISVLLNFKRVSTKLIVYKKDKSNRVHERILSFQWEYHPLKNKFQLYRHFLKGVQIFRPDIKIQPNTLVYFKLMPPPELTESQKKYDKIFNIVFYIFGIAILIFIIYVIWMFIKIFFYK
ncbi:MULTISPECIES: hypothetical protein [unclassified Chryseobacterium]|uniref:hypothetical protein n=1 Tax=unclassified Chryseobacterium TaxID=2593645 RepID=UPI00226AA31E|nr:MULTISPECIES: hypothetical protein [unclassified Chryseobacterium]